MKVLAFPNKWGAVHVKTQCRGSCCEIEMNYRANANFLYCSGERTCSGTSLSDQLIFGAECVYLESALNDEKVCLTRHVGSVGSRCVFTQGLSNL